jgi:hypothetical protein
VWEDKQNGRKHVKVIDHTWYKTTKSMQFERVGLQCRIADDKK